MVKSSYEWKIYEWKRKRLNKQTLAVKVISEKFEYLHLLSSGPVTKSLITCKSWTFHMEAKSFNRLRKSQSRVKKNPENPMNNKFYEMGRYCQFLRKTESFSIYINVYATERKGDYIQHTPSRLQPLLLKLTKCS